MEIIRVGDRPAIPWRNGGGVTRELLVARSPGADFDWRISVATIARDGPFSGFAGYDRTLICLDGRGTLRLPDRCEALGAGTAIRFDGGAAAGAAIDGGPLTVLNIMSHRATWRHEIRRCDMDGVAAPRDGVVRLFAILGAGTLGLSPGDLIVERGPDDAPAGIPGVEIALRRR